MPEQAEAEIGVFVVRTRIELQRVSGKKVVKPFDSIIRVRIVLVLRREIEGHSGQAGRIGRQIEQGDPFSALRGHFYVTGQKLRYRVLERDFAARRHFGEQQRGEHLGDGADLEHGIGVERPFIVGRRSGRGRTRAVRRRRSRPRPCRCSVARHRPGRAGSLGSLHRAEAPRPPCPSPRSKFSFEARVQRGHEPMGARFQRYVQAATCRCSLSSIRRSIAQNGALEHHRNPHGGDLVAEGLRAALQNANGDPRADDGVERVLIGFEREAGGVPVEFGEPRLDALDMSLQRGDDARPDREQFFPSQRRGEPRPVSADLADLVTRASRRRW